MSARDTTDGALGSIRSLSQPVPAPATTKAGSRVERERPRVVGELGTGPSDSGPSRKAHPPCLSACREGLTASICPRCMWLTETEELGA